MPRLGYPTVPPHTRRSTLYYVSPHTLGLGSPAHAGIDRYGDPLQHVHVLRVVPPHTRG